MLLYCLDTVSLCLENKVKCLYRAIQNHGDIFIILPRGAARDISTNKFHLSVSLEFKTSRSRLDIHNLLVIVMIVSDVIITPPRNRGGVIISLQFVCVCVCVSVCVCLFVC